MTSFNISFKRLLLLAGFSLVFVNANAMEEKLNTNANNSIEKNENIEKKEEPKKRMFVRVNRKNNKIKNDESSLNSPDLLPKNNPEKEEKIVKKPKIVSINEKRKREAEEIVKNRKISIFKKIVNVFKKDELLNAIVGVADEFLKKYLNSDESYPEIEKNIDAFLQKYRALDLENEAYKACFNFLQKFLQKNDNKIIEDIYKKTSDETIKYYFQYLFYIIKNSFIGEVKTPKTFLEISYVAPSYGVKLYLCDLSNENIAMYLKPILKIVKILYPSLATLKLYKNNLTELDLSGFEGLKFLDLSKNVGLKEINIECLTELKELTVDKEVKIFGTEPKKLWIYRK